jgi:hypothetical protein
MRYWAVFVYEVLNVYIVIKRVALLVNLEWLILLLTLILSIIENHVWSMGGATYKFRGSFVVIQLLNVLLNKGLLKIAIIY